MKKLTWSCPFIIVTSICMILILFVGISLVMPSIREWQVKQSIPVPESAVQLFENTRPQSGGYSQRNIYYWILQDFHETKQYYEDFTTPFVDVSSNDSNWIIATWNTSNVKESSDRGVYIHTDLCDYRETFDCLSIVIIDNRQNNIGVTLQSMFGLTLDKLTSIPSGGTLIIFTYTIPV